MHFKNQVKFFWLFCLLIGTINAKAQSNSIYDDILYNYKNAIKYYESKEYSNASAFFDKVIQTKIPSQNSQIELFKSESKFYNAIIAAKLGVVNADKIMMEFYENTINLERKQKISNVLAEYYFEKGNYINAQDWYSKSSEKTMDKESKESFYFKNAYVLMKNGRTDQAIATFKQSIQFSRSIYYEDANYYAGLLLFNQKKYDEAEKYLEVIRFSKNPKLDVPFILGQIHFIKKNYTQVISLNETLADDTKVERYQLLGKSYFELKEYKKSQEFLMKYISKTDKVSAEDMYQLAFSEYKNDDYKTAIGHFKELQLSKEGFGEYAMYALADCYLKNGEKNNARLAFMSAQQSAKDVVIKEESSFNIAKLNFDLNNYNDAIKGFADFNEKFPNSKHSTESWNLLTKSLLYSNNYPQAIELIEKNPQLQQNNEKLYQEICYTYAVNANNNSDTLTALKYLKKSILNPHDKQIAAEAYYLKADILYNMSDYVGAIREYNEVYKILTKENIKYGQNATLFNVYYGLAYSEYNLKNYANALSQFNNCTKNLSINPSVIEANRIQDIKLRIADINFILKDYEKAYVNYAFIAKEKGKGYDYATLQKANIEGIRKNYKEKINTLNSLLVEDNKSIYYFDAKYQLALAYEDDKNINSAIKTYTEIEKSPNAAEFAPKSLIRLATINYNNEKTAEALNYYSKVAENYPTSPEADQSLKAIKEIFISQGKPEEYITFIQKLPNAKQLEVSEQDSLLFEAGEELYANQNCEKAIPYFIKYLDKFPQGIFSAKAHFYKAECYVLKKQFDDAIEEYNFLIKENNNPYYEKALVKAAYYSYNSKKDYNASKSLYQKLLSIASTRQNNQLSKIGLLESNYRLKNHNEVIEIAKLIDNDPEINQDIKSDALYYKAKSTFYLKNYKSSMPLFELFVNDKNSERSAEATYYIAWIHHIQKDFAKSNNILLKAKDEYGSYEYWVIKYFILIAYNYHKLGDNFQAKATLESILQNYNGDKSLVAEAEAKLKEIVDSMKENSKVTYK